MSEFLSFHLSDDFIKSYRNEKVNWKFDIGGGNSLSELTFLTKYSRKKPDGKKEKWWEVCQRCIEGMYSILKDHCAHQRTPWNEFKAQKAAQDAFDRMFNFKWTPPGRGMWAMGTAFVHENQSNSSLNNPLHVDTPVLTRDGWQRLGGLAGQTVEVLSSTFLYGREPGMESGVSKWVKAEVSEIEHQPSVEIRYRTTLGEESSIIASENHRWFRKAAHHHNWKRVRSTDLTEGDFLPTVRPRKNFKVSVQGQQHGFFFGDGTRSNGELHQFGDSVNILHRLFGNQTVYSNKSAVVRQCPLAWGTIPDGAYLDDQRYVYGFLSGYFAADGHVNKQGHCSISSARYSELAEVRKLFLNIGIETSHLKLASTESNYSSSRELWTIRLNRFDLDADFFLQDHHRERWIANTLGKPRTKKYARIISVTPVDDQPVLCATVPEYEQFVTQDFVLTSNCAFISTEKLSNHSAYEATMPFSRLMEMSMNGVGVGFDTKGAGKLTIWEPTGEPVDFVVPDTREGWSESIAVLLESYFFKNRAPVKFDYSLIRPAGTPLKTFGGTASGPGPLIALHESIVKQFAGRHGELLTSRDITDIFNKEGKAVVAGGARRSALIGLGDINDDDYINIKNWELPENAERTGPDGWAWTSNNSVLVNSNDSLDSIVDKVGVNGEPGIIWLDMMRKYGRLADPVNDKDYRVMGCNPCVTADTWVMTSFGPRQVFDLIDTPHTSVVDGCEYRATGFWHTGDKPVYRVTFADGRELRLTDNHQLLTTERDYVEVKDLQIGESIVLNHHNGYNWHGFGCFDEGYLLGHLIGDGTFDPNGQPFLAVWQEDEGSDVVADYIYETVDRMGHRADWSGWFTSSNQRRLGTSSLRDLASKFGVGRGSKTITPELEMVSSEMSRGVLSGLFDTDGSVQGTQLKGVSVRLTNTDRDLLAASQRMLGRLGINSTIYFRRPEHTTMLPDGRGGFAEYECKPQWELVISKENLAIFAERVGFRNPIKQRKLEQLLESYKRALNAEKWSSEIISIAPDGFESVYDVTVDEVHAFDANGLMAHNCAEISLEPHEFCCLVELYPSRHDNLVDFKKSMKHAYMYAKAVTLMPSTWGETNEVITRNRRIGVSMTGIVDFIEQHGWNDMRQWMDEGYQYLNFVDNKYSEWLGVRNSVKLTTVKPAGTTSIIAGTTSGVHWPTTSGYYIRRIRFHKTDPLLPLLREAGYEVEDDQMDPTSTAVASFPTKGLDVRSEREVSMFEKASLAAMAQRYWADNMVSVTVSFREDELNQISPLLRSMQGQLKSISFLPITDAGTSYAQAPYEPISKDEALEMMAKVKPLDFKALYSVAEEGEGEKFCNNDTCEISFGGSTPEIRILDDILQSGTLISSDMGAH